MAAAMLYIVSLFVSVYMHGVAGDYKCACNYNVEIRVMGTQSVDGTQLGSMYEFDCKENIVSLDTDQWLAIAFKHEVGYVKVTAQTQQQICSGEPSVDDTVFTTMSTTPLKASTGSDTTSPPMVTNLSTLSALLPSSMTASTMPSTVTPSTSTSSTSSPFTMPSTTVTTSTLPPTMTESTTSPTSVKPSSSTSTTDSSHTSSIAPITTQSPIQTTAVVNTPDIPGDISRCPSAIRVQTQTDGGALGHFRDSCYELLPAKVNHEHAYQLCKSRGGNLVDILDGKEQAYLYAFTQRCTPTKAVWTGLYDRRTEGNFEWTSGAAVSYTNWIPGHTDNFLSHEDEDCVLMIPYKNGEWDDTPCGFSGIFGDLGESHIPLCEYKLSTDNVIIG